MASFIFLVVTFAGTHVSGQLRYSKQLSQDVTSLLDQLLREDIYDKRFRPNFGGEPVTIEVNLYIKSLGPVLETEEVFSTDLYLRHMWFDERLAFNLSNINEFSLNWLFLDKVWTPDTYIINGVSGTKLHTITVPNKFLRLRSDGLMTYSMRLTIRASCRMHLRKFPLDQQRCMLLLGSYGYSINDVRYKWKRPTPVDREEGVNLAQYDLVEILTNELRLLTSRKDNASVISAEFHLSRHTGYFLLQVYVPCTLIVFCSWVSFWIDPAAVPARVSLGMTTVLSLTTLGFGGRASMPRTSYATALDWFVILCFAFVFASMVEYACINYMDKVSLQLGGAAGAVPRPISGEGKIYAKTSERKSRTQKAKVEFGISRKVFLRISQWIVSKLQDPWEFVKTSPNKFSALDIYSRKVFPICFGLFNIIYWISFTYIIGNEFPPE